MSGTGSKIAGIVMVAVLLAGLGDLIRNPGGANAVFGGTNTLLNTTLTGASGGYA